MSRTLPLECRWSSASAGVVMPPILVEAQAGADSGEVGPERAVELRAQLAERIHVLRQEAHELCPQIARKLWVVRVPGPLPSEPLGDLGERLEAEELLRPAHLREGVGAAALELEDQDAVAPEELERSPHLPVVLAAPDRVADDRDVRHGVVAVGEPQLAADPRSVALDRVSQHDQDARLGSNPREQGERPEV